MLISLKVVTWGRHMWDYFPKHMDHGTKRGRTDRIQESAWWEEAWRARLRSYERRQRFWAETSAGTPGRRVTGWQQHPAAMNGGISPLAPGTDRHADRCSCSGDETFVRQEAQSVWKVVSVQLLVRPLSDKSLLLCFFAEFPHITDAHSAHVSRIQHPAS